MSQNFDIIILCPSLYFMKKKGKLLDIFFTLHQITTKTYIKKLRQLFLNMYVKNDVLKFQVYKCNSHSDTCIYVFFN